MNENHEENIVVDLEKYRSHQLKLNNFERYLKALPVGDLFNEIKKLIEDIEKSPLSHEIIKKAEILLNEFDYRIHLNMPNVSQLNSELVRLPKFNFDKLLEKKFNNYPENNPEA